MNTQQQSPARKQRAHRVRPEISPRGEIHPHDIYTVREAAARVGIGESSAWKLISEGKFPAGKKFGPRTRRITGQELIDFIQSSE